MVKEIMRLIELTARDVDYFFFSGKSHSWFLQQCKLLVFPNTSSIFMASLVPYSQKLQCSPEFLPPPLHSY